MAVAITAIAQDSWPPRVLVSVTGLTIGDGIALYRVVGGVRALLRAGETDAVTDTSFLRTDAELPFGQPVSYLAVVNDDDEYTTGAATYALPGGKVALTDAISGDAAETVILAWDERSYQRQSSVFRAGGRNIVVSGQLGQPESSLELYAETTSARDGVMAVVESATEGVVQIRQPGGYDGIDSYLAVLSVAERRWSQDGSDQRRIIALDVAEVEGWAPALEARGSTLQDIANVYDVAGPNLLPNSYFETNAAGWAQLGGTIARSTTQAHEGAASLLLTPSGAAGAAQARADLVPASVGTLFRARAWVRCAVARSVRLSMDWHDSGAALLSTSNYDLAVAANTWTLMDTTFTPPASTAQARMLFQLTSTPPNTHLLYIDEATLNVAYQSLARIAADYPGTLLDIAQADWS
ncbi:carbohydrate binding domain-containing protein [Micromonospora sp. NPDC049580]|uniref:carbohydrate binding domain-containing protein n=1 Tax=Micromonospora sp. NPDC049580 TaxID=3154832 RepID=UPI00341FD93D